MRRKILIIIILLIPLFFINLDTIVLGFIYNKEYLLKIPNENMFKRLFIISWSELAKDKSALSNMGKATYLLLPLQLFEEDVKDNQVKESILIIDNQKKGLLCGYYSPFKGNLALAAYLFYFIEGNDIFCQQMECTRPK